MEDVTKKNWEPRPVNGEELAGLAKEVVNQPPDVAAALKRILSRKLALPSKTNLKIRHAGDDGHPDSRSLIRSYKSLDFRIRGNDG